MKNLLVVMAKAPIPGQVKTRLTPGLSATEAAEIAGCFLRDRMTEMENLTECDKALAYLPKSAWGIFQEYASRGYTLFSQTGRDLGERMENIFRGELQAGRPAVVVIGTDSPDLPRSVITRAFERLSDDSVDVVIGPAADGGYYLVGMKQDHPELFEDIPWGTGDVLLRTLGKAQDLGVETALLTEWNDIDTFQDLQRLCDRYENTPTGDPRVGSHTMACLRALRRRGRF